jgi:hypothetical protein
MHLKLISCEIFFREMCAAVSRSLNVIDLEFLPKGLHDIGAAGMLARLQAALDRAEGKGYDAVLLGYALCNNGISGLSARSCPLVVPRAHDCITLFLGSKERYLDYFNSNSGVYFKTTGWIERGEDKTELRQLSIARKIGMGQSFDELVAKYGEDNARYLMAELGDYTKQYQQLTFIEMGVEADGRFEKQTMEEAAARGWKFEKVKGDMSLIQRMVDGIWEGSEFLVVRPGETISPTYDEDIIAIDV